jgi:hypothetical protein
MARALLQATQQMSPPLSRQQPVPTYVVIDEDADGTSRLIGVVLVSDLYLGPVPPTPEQVDRANDFMVAHLTKNPVEVHHDLRLAAQRAVQAEGDYMGAVLKAAAAAETLIKRRRRSCRATRGQQRCPAAPSSKRSVPACLPGALGAAGGTWDSSRPGHPVGGAWRLNVAQVRNRIIHLGHRPSGADAVAALEGLAALEEHLMDRLASRASVYPGRR